MQNIASASARAIAAFGRGAGQIGGRALNEMGTIAESAIQKVIQQCFKPKGSKSLSRGIKGSKRSYDEVEELAGEIFNLEVKSRIPSKNSAAIRRLKQQLLDAQGAGDRVILIGVDTVKSDKLNAAIGYFRRAGVNTNPDSLLIFNGLLSFVVWVGETVAEECLGI